MTKSLNGVIRPEFNQSKSKKHKESAKVLLLRSVLKNLTIEDHVKLNIEILLHNKSRGENA